MRLGIEERRFIDYSMKSRVIPTPGVLENMFARGGESSQKMRGDSSRDPRYLQRK